MSNTDSPDNKPGLPSEEFVREFTRSQRYLYLFVLAQIGKSHDADEILQNTNLVIWTKFSQFQPGTNFLSWSYQIASFEVMKFRQKAQRSKLLFDDDVLSGIAQSLDRTPGVWESRWQALEQCLQKLHATDQQIIRKRYLNGLSGKELADAVGRPVNSLYQSIGRIRKSLLACINRELAGDIR